MKIIQELINKNVSFVRKNYKLSYYEITDNKIIILKIKYFL